MIMPAREKFALAGIFSSLFEKLSEIHAEEQESVN